MRMCFRAFSLALERAKLAWWKQPDPDGQMDTPALTLLQLIRVVKDCWFYDVKLCVFKTI